MKSLEQDIHYGLMWPGVAYAINFISNLIPGGFPKGHLFVCLPRSGFACSAAPHHIPLSHRVARIMNEIGEILHCNRSGATDAITKLVIKFYLLHKVADGTVQGI